MKQQLAHSSPPSTPMHPPSTETDQPTPPISHSSTLADLQQAQALSDKEEALKRKEQSLVELQEKLELASKNAAVPSIVVEASGDNNSTEDDKDEKLAFLAEKERLLAEKEQSLEAQRHQVEQEQRLALEQVASQMDKLRLEVNYNSNAKGGICVLITHVSGLFRMTKLCPNWPSRKRNWMIYALAFKIL